MWMLQETRQVCRDAITNSQRTCAEGYSSQMFVCLSLTGSWTSRISALTTVHILHFQPHLLLHVGGGAKKAEVQSAKTAINCW